MLYFPVLRIFLCCHQHLSRQMMLPAAHHEEVCKVSSSVGCENLPTALFFPHVISFYCVLGGVNHMKYIAGFEYTDDEWDTMDKTARRKVSEVILDLLLSPTYRIP